MLWRGRAAVRDPAAGAVLCCVRLIDEIERLLAPLVREPWTRPVEAVMRGQQTLKRHLGREVRQAEPPVADEAVTPIFDELIEHCPACGGGARGAVSAAAVAADRHAGPWTSLPGPG